MKKYSNFIVIATIAAITAVICIIIMSVKGSDPKSSTINDVVVNAEEQTKEPETEAPETEKEVIVTPMTFVRATEMPTITLLEATPMPIPFSDEEIDIMAKILYGEAECVKSEAERSMVIWCMLNRYDVSLFGDTTIAEICTRPRQFAYNENNPVTERNRGLVLDVIERWAKEKNGEEHIGRTLPAECLYFLAASNPAKGEWHNTFFSYTNVVYGEKVSFGYEHPLENPYEN